MGTNFYLFPDNKEVVKTYAPYSYELVDKPFFGYTIHIAKTSYGWLPLFQAHENIKSINSLKEAYNTGLFKILDEYSSEYTWDEFDKRVLQFNGGVKGAIPCTKIERNINSPLYDKNMPNHVPVSHFEYGDYSYTKEYFCDPDGYEFTTHWFS